MAKLLPFRSPERATRERAPQLVNLDDEDADAVFAALSSDTARAILNRLYEEPATASDAADAADTSLQNARYHLEKLRDADLIEEVDTWYSSRGTEMTVYAPTSEPLVVAAGREESTSVLRDALARVLSAVALLAIASVLVDRVIRRLPGPGYRERGDGGQAGGAATPRAAADTPTEEVVETPTPAEATEAPMATPTETAETEVAVEMDTTAREATETPTATSMETPTEAPEATPAPTPTPEPEAERLAVEEVTTTAAQAPAGGPLDALPPGVLFFAGGLLVLALAAGWWYWSRYRPLYG